jgi:hypothetical protein
MGRPRADPEENRDPGQGISFRVSAVVDIEMPIREQHRFTRGTYQMGWCDIAAANRKGNTTTHQVWLGINKAVFSLHSPDLERPWRGRVWLNPPFDRHQVGFGLENRRFTVTASPCYTQERKPDGSSRYGNGLMGSCSWPTGLSFAALMEPSSPPTPARLRCSALSARQMSRCSGNQRSRNFFGDGLDRDPSAKGKGHLGWRAQKRR